MTTLGIDLGTGSVKAAVVGADGVVGQRTTHPYRVRSPHPGCAEGDPREWLVATREVLSSVTAGLREPLSGVGISGQMHGIVVTDRHFKPLRPAILWADTRAVREVEELTAALPRELLSRLGSPAVTGFAATSLAWLQRHEAETMKKAAHVLQPKDWLRVALGGELATDPSDASGTLMYDVVGGGWSSAVLDWLGIDESLLPPVRPSESRSGGIRVDRVKEEIPCVVGAADTACAIAGLGMQVGDAYLAVGTGAQLVSVLEAPNVDYSMRTHTFACAGEPGFAWFRLGAVQSAGLVLSSTLRSLNATAEDAARALHTGVLEDDPVFVPFLAGERTPFMDARLRGAWHGLTLATDREAMLRSVLEGVAQAVALAVDAVNESGVKLPEALPLIGGGTHDPEFRQLLADATGLTLLVAEVPDAAVAGAALLAATSRSTQPMPSSEAVVPQLGRSELLRERRAMMVATVMSLFT